MTKLIILKQYVLLHFSGRDAGKFLQGQLTQDILSLQNNQLAMAGYCSPKGRLLATGLIWGNNEDFFWQIQADVADFLIKRLKLFILRDQVTITDYRDQLIQIGIIEQDLPACLHELSLPCPDPNTHIKTDDYTVLRLSKNKAILILPKEEISQVFSQKTLDLEIHSWQMSQIQDGIAEIGLTQQDQWVPQMVNLDLLNGISFKKGCYTGQEIVARTHYLGAVKRRLVHAYSTGEVTEGESLYNTDQDNSLVGHVLNCEKDSKGGTHYLAVIQVDAVRQQVVIQTEKQHLQVQIQPPSYPIPELLS